jgi:hypothetical protein
MYTKTGRKKHEENMEITTEEDDEENRKIKTRQQQSLPTDTPSGKNYFFFLYNLIDKSLFSTC